MKLKIGMWIAFYMDGDMLRDDNCEALCFKTKQEALKMAMYDSCDYNKNPKVQRIRNGMYWHYPKSWETGKYHNIIVIERLMPENISEYTDMANYTGNYER